jgi:hypothetical protein
MRLPLWKSTVYGHLDASRSRAVCAERYQSSLDRDRALLVSALIAAIGVGTPVVIYFA